MANRQKGQALVESVVGLSFVIVPLLIIFPLLAKVSSAQHRADQAAHYNAWERTVWKEGRPDRMPSRSGLYVAIRSDEEQMQYLPWRIYQQDGRKIATRQKDQWSWDNNVHPLLKYPLKRDGTNSLLLKNLQESAKDEQELARISGSQQGSGTPGTYGASVERAVGMLSFTGFKLPRDQFYRTQVKTDLENLEMSPFDQLNLSVEGQSALLASGWNAAGPYHVKSRVRRLVLTNYMDVGVIRTAQNLIGIIPFGKEIKSNSLKLGFVEPDVLPANRLCTYGTKNCGG
ncbi:hypothetical protein [Shewanella spartinae]|uniref:hypothetical protein n=1 Tax=Shewanella spartinae TaxID=2864205 RepID=UPI001C655364|nr:hypothetical protein [Shewanella spartinae]QYJ94429.1 hypothetical protein K0I31_03305 [Shewanella spartinae]